MANEPEASFRLPMSGVVLGVVADVLGLNPVNDGGEVFADRSQQRFFRGERVKDGTREKIIAGYAESLIAHKHASPPRAFASKWPEILTRALAYHAQEWDSLVGWLGGASARVSRRELAPRPFLRLATIDLALRSAALSATKQGRLPEPDLPLWAEAEDAGNLLRHLRSQCEPKLTVDELTTALTGHDTTTDRWLYGGVRPSDENIERLAAVLSPRLETGTEEVSERLRTHYSLHRLATALAGQVGREEVIKLASAYTRFRKRSSSILQERDYSEEQRLKLALLGGQSPEAEPLLEVLWNEERHRLWATELRAVNDNWAARLLQTARQLSCLDHPEIERRLKEVGVSPEQQKEMHASDAFIDLLQSDTTTMTPAMLAAVPNGKWIKLPGDDRTKAMNRSVQADEAIRAGDRPAALAHWRRAVQLQPLNAEYQFSLGCSLWQMAVFERRGDEEMIADALKALWMSNTLKPEWDKPLVEIGIVYFVTNRPGEALAHLEDAAKKVAMTPWLALHLGAALSPAERFQDALKLFEYVIEQEPDNVRALDWGAHCALRLGDKKEGEELAKQARDRGLSQSHDLWKSGFYRKTP